MNYNAGHCLQPSRQPTMPPLSSRTLHHPSFMPLYLAAGYEHHTPCCCFQTVSPMVPSECFYIDPTMSCGRRIPNTVSELRVYDCFQLNTPAPVMSACLAPPNAPDPFRSAQHPTVDLGSFTYRTHLPLHHQQQPPPVQPGPLVLTLTQEEDQAITNLLKLHLQEPSVDFTIIDFDLDFMPFPSKPTVHSLSAEDVHKSHCPQVQQSRVAGCSRGQHPQQERRWSDTELQAANTLLTGFSLTEKDTMWGQKKQENSHPPPYQRQGSETLPELISADSTQNNTGGHVSSGGVTGHPGWGGVGCADEVDFEVCLSTPSLSSDSEAKSRSEVSGDISDVRARVLSECERDAVQALLSLGDTGTLETMK